MSSSSIEGEKAEEELRRQLALATSIINNAAEGLYAIDARGHVTFINPAAERMLGWAEGELLGRYVHGAIHSQRADGTPCPAEECPLLGVIRSGSALRDREETFTLRDGRTLPVLCSSSPIFRDGRVTGAVVTFHDLTERTRAEAYLREQAEVIDTINRVGQTVAAELDLNKVVQAVTDVATELTGARFGSFFYNVINEEGASYMLYTLSGVPREAFEHFPMRGPRTSLDRPSAARARC